MARKPYPTDVSDDEWAFVAPCLSRLPDDAGQRRHDLREVFDGLRYVVRGGVTWRLVPNDTSIPPRLPVFMLKSALPMFEVRMTLIHK